MSGSSWQPPDPVPLRDEEPRRDDPVALKGPLDRLLRGFGAPPADALSAVFDRWSGLAGLPLADHGVPVRLEAGVLVVAVREPGWATEWKYGQGTVIRRCDQVLGEGVVERVEVQVRRA